MEKLNNYDPKFANAKVSTAAMIARLEALDTVADNPAKVRAWVQAIWKELMKCEVA